MHCRTGAPGVGRRGRRPRPDRLRPRSPTMAGLGTGPPGAPGPAGSGGPGHRVGPGGIGTLAASPLTTLPPLRTAENRKRHEFPLPEYRPPKEWSGIPPGGRASRRAGCARRLALPNSDPQIRRAVLRKPRGAGNQASWLCPASAGASSSSLKSAGNTAQDARYVSSSGAGTYMSSVKKMGKAGRSSPTATGST